MPKKHVGILGFGALGQYLADKILHDEKVADKFELAFIQNRSVDKIRESNLKLKPHQILSENIDVDFVAYLQAGNPVDLVIECSHPDVVREHGGLMLTHASLMITSLTALADDKLRQALEQVSKKSGHHIIIPTGAGWGFEDIRKMADRDMLEGLSISMKFNADALKLCGKAAEALTDYKASDDESDRLLCRGSVRELAALAPNNVNTMCGLALAGHTIGFDGTQGILIASKSSHAHEVEIDVRGRDGYRVKSHRINPAQAGAVTGSMTFVSFLDSLMDWG